MAIIVQPPKIIPRLTAMSPYEIYLQQVKAAYDGIRSSRLNLSYYPAQFGGIFGQRDVINEVVVLELTDFQVGENNGF